MNTHTHTAKQPCLRLCQPSKAVCHDGFQTGLRREKATVTDPTRWGLAFRGRLVASHPARPRPQRWAAGVGRVCPPAANKGGLFPRFAPTHPVTAPRSGGPPSSTRAEAPARAAPRGPRLQGLPVRRRAPRPGGASCGGPGRLLQDNSSSSASRRPGPVGGAWAGGGRR